MMKKLIVAGLILTALAGCLSDKDWKYYQEQIPPCPESRLDSFELEMYGEEQRDFAIAAFRFHNYTSISVREMDSDYWTVRGDCEW